MLLKLKYNPILNDLFSAGVLLFNLVTGRSPFATADPKTGMYKYLATNQHQKYWVEYDKKIKLSPEFKELINGMLSFDPTERLTIAEIKCHPWYKQDILMADGNLDINLRN